MPLDKTAVARIAALARIRLGEAELEPLAEELSQILSWMEQLNEVGTSDVSTSFSCSIQLRICESSSARGSSSASPSLMRARAAIRATAVLSSGMRSRSPKSSDRTGYHRS